MSSVYATLKTNTLPPLITVHIRRGDFLVSRRPGSPLLSLPVLSVSRCSSITDLVLRRNRLYTFYRRLQVRRTASSRALASLDQGPRHDGRNLRHRLP